MKKPLPEEDAVTLVRAIRDEQARNLARMSREQILEFFDMARTAALAGVCRKDAQRKERGRGSSNGAHPTTDIERGHHDQRRSASAPRG
ncbi:MAG: hypothetical protein HY899_05475 [Deltaproteobacteria bacterium]|nr:hypothetical protein [Deltaproteobacteria bacterium]